MSADASPIRVELLGPLRAWRGAHELDLGWPKQRAVLVILALRADKAISRDELVDAVWGEQSHRNAAGDMYKYLSQLRRLLEPGLAQRATASVLTSGTSGYRLR